jgi:hypothetical protein
MKGQVILIIISSVIFLIDYCLRCGTEHSIPQSYMKYTAGLLIQLFPQGSPRSCLACHISSWNSSTISGSQNLPLNDFGFAHGCLNHALPPNPARCEFKGGLLTKVLDLEKDSDPSTDSEKAFPDLG